VYKVSCLELNKPKGLTFKLFSLKKTGALYYLLAKCFCSVLVSQNLQSANYSEHRNCSAGPASITDKALTLGMKEQQS
jgi:hypothetical protein